MDNKQEININGAIYVPKGSESELHTKPKLMKGLWTKVLEFIKSLPGKRWDFMKGMEFCIVRTYSAGVFAGYWNRKIKGKEGTIHNSRRIFYWDGANSLSELAMKGTAKPRNCKFAVVVPETDLKEVIEILPCTTKAKKNIEGVKIWEH